MKGILLKPPMIKATIEKRKTVTRRTSGLKEINESPDDWDKPIEAVRDVGKIRKGDWIFQSKTNSSLVVVVKPRYRVGENVYIKEAWKVIDVDTRTLKDELYHIKVEYKDGSQSWGKYVSKKVKFTIPDKWHSPMMIPEKVARYHIMIKDARPQRLQEMLEEDIIAEGVDYMPPMAVGVFGYNRYSTFTCYWDSINKPPYDWDSNPWVFPYNYELVEK